jgi:catechol 2,3-dioxygenase-like lactoylglutathione lyase family enzyme
MCQNKRDSESCQVEERWGMNVERISAVTLKIASMQASVHFYRDLLGMDVIYGDERGAFCSLRTWNPTDPILNLEQGRATTQWGRLIFYVPKVDALWKFLKEKGLQSGTPQDAWWGERYFYVYDPDGHELSFAHPLR